MASGSRNVERTLEYSEEEHRQLSLLMGNLNNMRKEGTLCDVTVVVRGRHFSAHRGILSTAGEFFRLMFTSESSSHEVELETVDPEIFELLLEFIYTARISVNRSNVQSLMEAANLLQIESVKKLCMEYNDRELGTMKKRHTYIAVFGGSQLQTHLFNPDEYSWKELECPSLNPRGTAVFCDSTVYIIGGRKDKMMTYDVETKLWGLHFGPPTKRNSINACVSDGKIYTSGGATGKCALDVFECFDPRTGSWQVKPNMLKARCGHSSVYANGLIYVCGGIEGPSQNNIERRVLRNCEVYDPNTQRWKKIRGMKDARKNHGLVVVNNRIFAIGGQGATGALDSVECYEIATKKWRSVSPMPLRDSRPNCAAVGEVIYVVSGKVTSPFHYVLEYWPRFDRFSWMTLRQAVACPSSSNSLTCVIELPHEEDPDPKP